ncbi:MAG: transglutaminase-like domain-containing protein [Lachnospiraceae bacterium]|nr:transglutaminase-like domain-containing protein [Lachnospiraceae bacterium]
MKKLRSSSIGNIKRFIQADEIAAFILAITLSVTAMSLYEENILRMVLKCAVMGLFTIAMCMTVNRNRFIGAFITIGYLVLYFIIIGNTITVGERDTGVYFWQWMVSGGSESTLEIEAGTDAMLQNGMYMAVTLFFVITIYYFAGSTYRLGYLTLVSLLPFVLYAKVTEQVENKYLVVVVFASMLLHLVCAGKVSPSRAELKEAKKESTLLKYKEPIHANDWNIKIRGKWAYLAAFAVMSVAILAASAVIPKRSSARYYDKFEDLFLGGDTDSEIDENFSSLADFSGNADNFREGSNRRLYTVVGEGGAYLKRQVFDAYDYEKNRWYSIEAAVNETNPEVYLLQKKLLSISNLMSLIKYVSSDNDEFVQKYNLEKIAESDIIPDIKTKYTITAQNFGASYYLSADRLCDADIEDADFHMTDAGTMYRTGGPHDNDFSYSIDVYNSKAALNKFAELGGLNMSADDSEKMLIEIKEILLNKAREAKKSENKDNNEQENKESEIELNDDELAMLVSNLKIAFAFLDDIRSARDYKRITDGEYITLKQGGKPAEAFQIEQNEIEALAFEITKDASYDWEKAALLERYFRENDFLYDIKYRAPDDSPYYFLFEGKTGTCSDYASAYVLMARAAGLIVRYTEGFVPESTYGDLYHVVTEADSHAYAEVFIENVGWVAFDPTAGVRNADSGNIFDFLKSLHVDMGLLSVLGIAAIIIAAVIIFVRFIIPFVSEAAFRVWLYFAKPQKALIVSYKRLIKKAGGKIKSITEDNNSGKSKSASYITSELTPGELADFAAVKGIDISEYILLVENISYGHKDKVTTRSVILKGYADGCKALRAKNKRKA